MCDETSRPHLPAELEDHPAATGISRRTFLQATGAMLAAGVAAPATRHAASARRLADFPTHPNILIMITDQERTPQHWPAGWADTHLPNRKRIADHGLTFTQACCNTAMCSPSRATLFTGLYPATHGVVATLTEGGTNTYYESELPVTIQNMARLLASAGYNVQYRGKWHMSRHADGGQPTHDDIAAYGFKGWNPIDAGGAVDPDTFGGGCAAWDVKYTADAVSFLQSAEADGPAPWALIFSLVNPHDLLSYPGTWNHQEEGGCNNYVPYAPGCFQQNISLPPTFGEDLAASYKPTAQQQTIPYLNNGIGVLNPEEGQPENYVNFYAYLHTITDDKIGQVLDTLEAKPGLSDKTVVIRFADHGEMGLSHGGLRQKIFNAYEETMRVPLVVSDPVYFPTPVQSNAMVSLIDIMPTLASLVNVPNPSDWTFQGKDLTPIILDAAHNPANPTASVQENTLFTYDDENNGSPVPQTFVKQPNHLRCLREKRWKYAVYFDPSGKEPSQHELYDRETDPYEEHNCADPRNTAYYNPTQVSLMQARLAAKMQETNTLPYHAWLPAIDKHS